MMKPALQLRMSQQLTMTPQLQQAIKLLQLSTLELHAEIQEALEANPLLELNEEHDNDADTSNSSTDKPTKDDSELASDTALSQDNVPDELPTDMQWDMLSGSSGGAKSSGNMEDREFERQSKTTESLYDHLMWQMNLTPFSALDAAIATAIIDAIDENGYLSCSLEDILTSLGDLPADENGEAAVELDEIEAKLKSHSLVKDCAVEACDEASTKSIVAYVVFNKNTVIADDDLVKKLRKDLRDLLPVSMQPREYKVLEKLPLTDRGKVDRASLTLA